jgi:acylphosphatase
VPEEPGPGASSQQVRTRVVVHGRVQGVFFRDTLRSQARQQEVNGWARNRPDGTLEAVFEGPRAAVSSLVDLSRRGPRAAHVDRIETFDEEPEGLNGFSIA